MSPCTDRHPGPANGSPIFDHVFTVGYISNGNFVPQRNIIDGLNYANFLSLKRDSPNVIAGCDVAP